MYTEQPGSLLLKTAKFMPISLYACIKEYTFGYFATSGESFEVPNQRHISRLIDVMPGKYELVDEKYLGRVHELIERSIDAPKDAQRLRRTVHWYQAIKDTQRDGKPPTWWCERPWAGPPWAGEKRGAERVVVW